MSEDYAVWKAYAENLQAQRENDSATIEELQEALARVERERDVAKLSLLNTECEVLLVEGQRDKTQAQLAEAVAFIKQISEWPDGGRTYGQDRIKHVAKKFLARHAQAELEEYIGPHGRELLAHIRGEV